MQADSAVEGADVVDGRNERLCIPVDLGVVFRRLDACLRQTQNRALVAVEMPQEDRLRTPSFWIYEVELKDKGKVHEIDLITRARELGCIDPFELPLEHFYRAPPH